MRKRRAQEYSPAEFDAVVDLIGRDAQARRNIEAITGAKLTGKTPREIFNLYLAVKDATDVKLTVAAYGKASVLLDEARREVEGQNALQDELKEARDEIKDLKQANASLKRGLDLQQRQIENATAAPAMAVYAEGTGQ